jgi:hypothetical protein
VDCAIATQFSNKKKYKIKKAAFSSWCANHLCSP